MTPEAVGLFGGFGVLFLPMKASEKKTIGSNDPIPFIFPGKMGLFVYRGMAEPQVNHIDKKEGAGDGNLEAKPKRAQIGVELRQETATRSLWVYFCVLRLILTRFFSLPSLYFGCDLTSDTGFFSKSETQVQ